MSNIQISFTVTNERCNSKLKINECCRLCGCPQPNGKECIRNNDTNYIICRGCTTSIKSLDIGILFQSKLKVVNK